MTAALAVAEMRRERWVAQRLAADIERAAMVWECVVDEVVELVEYYPTVAEWV